MAQGAELLVLCPRRTALLPLIIAEICCSAPQQPLSLCLEEMPLCS